MSEQRKRRDSLLRSSISINSIRDSVSNFSKGLTESNAVANQIVEKTRQNNLFKSTLIRKENDYFRKRRENVRRKDREDELESASITGITKKEGNIIQRSTRGFLEEFYIYLELYLIALCQKLPQNSLAKASHTMMFYLYPLIPKSFQEKPILRLFLVKISNSSRPLCLRRWIQ